MPPVRGQEKEDGCSGDDISFSFPSVAAAAAATEDAESGKGASSDGGYGGWARRVMATASEGRFGRTLRIGPWAKKASRAESQTKGGSPGLWPRWDTSRPTIPTASRQQQRIARYRQEMLELVRDTPESAYELSLRDIIQLPRPADGRTEENDTAGTEGQMGTAGEGQQGTAAVKEKEEEEEMKRPEKKGTAGKEPWRFWRSRKDGSEALVWNMAFMPVVAGLSGWKRKATEKTMTTAKMPPKAVVHDEGKCDADKKAGDYSWGWQIRSKTKDRWVLGNSRSASSDGSSGSRSRRKQASCYAWL